MRISDWSSDVCSSDLSAFLHRQNSARQRRRQQQHAHRHIGAEQHEVAIRPIQAKDSHLPEEMRRNGGHDRSEEHTSELQSLMRISYAVFCLKKKKQNNNDT